MKFEDWIKEKGFVLFHGEKPGPWCAAYQRTKDRTICGERRCRYYQNHRHTRAIQPRQGESPDVTESLDAVSLKMFKIGNKVEIFEQHEECNWHCVRYDEPSKLIDLPWEAKE